MRNDDGDLVDVVRRCGKARPKIYTRLRREVLKVTAAIALVLAITHDEVFFLTDRIDQMHSADVRKVRRPLLREVVAEVELLIRVIDQREPQHDGPAAHSLELLNFDSRARL